MLNTQIPSGLQALMQAAQILQQQASPSAPGPQGQQPTVAKQVEQAAAQQAMPDMQAVGQQAGIAGQMMAQRQQQQQQMAQDPQAVAQMAAQMLQRGIGGLPANMQFREGGIIGYAGPEGSDVRLQPIPDRELAPLDDSLAAKAQREMAEMDSGQRVSFSRDVETFLSPELNQRAAKEAAFAEKERQRALETSRGIAQQYPQRPPRPPSYTPYAAVLESEFQRGAEAGPSPRAEPQVAPPEAPPKPAPAETRPETPSVPSAPSGIAAVAPRTRKTFEDIYKGVPEDAEAKKDMQAREEINRRMLEARRRQADLAQEGIAAIGRSEAERKRLLELERSRDAFNSFIKLTQALPTGGDQYINYKNSMKARDEADRVATLASQEAVLKLKQAQQAREMGDLEMEKKFLDEAAAYKKQVDDARMAKAKAIATFEQNLIPAEIQAETAAANRAQELKLKVDELKAKAAERRDLKLRDQISINGQRVSKAYADLEKSIKENFPTYGLVKNTAPDKLSANDRTIISQVNAMRDRVEKQIIAPLEALINEAAKELDIKMPEVPQVSGVDFSKLPK
jgi:hypothetical protein